MKRKNQSNEVTLIKEHIQQRKKQVDIVLNVLLDNFPEMDINLRTYRSVYRYVKQLPFNEILDAVEITCLRAESDFALKYFCGVCVNKINSLHE